MPRYVDVENIPKLFNDKYNETKKLISDGDYFLDNLAEGFTEADRIIRAMPTADVVEVVRCKDCKHYELMKANNQYFCNEFGGFVHSDDYCSRNSMVGE